MDKNEATAEGEEQGGGQQGGVGSGGGASSAASASTGHGEPAFLLKRIAHCADGHRTKDGTRDEVRILMQVNSPYFPVHVATGGASTPAPQPNQRVYGPFVTSEPDPVIYQKPRVIKVTVHFDGGGTVDVPAADALFWSMSAVEKFLLPWYASQYGIPVANHMYESFAQMSDVAALCHDPRSRSCDVEDPGRGVVGAEALLSEALRALNL